MCFLNKTDKLIAAIMRINSPLANIGNLVPKIVYMSGEDVGGIFFDPNRNQLVRAEFENGKLVEQYDVVPTHIEYPDENGDYPGEAHAENDQMANRYPCYYCGEADDLSCYAYFDCVDSDED